MKLKPNDFDSQGQVKFNVNDKLPMQNPTPFVQVILQTILYSERDYISLL